MRVGERAYRSIWLAADCRAVEIIDQTRLPFRFEIVRLESAAAAMDAIRTRCGDTAILRGSRRTPDAPTAAA